MAVFSWLSNNHFQFEIINCTRNCCKSTFRTCDVSVFPATLKDFNWTIHFFHCLSTSKAWKMAARFPQTLKDPGNQHNNGHHQDQVFDHPSTLCLAPWATKLSPPPSCTVGLLYLPSASGSARWARVSSSPAHGAGPPWTWWSPPSWPAPPGIGPSPASPVGTAACTSAFRGLLGRGLTPRLTRKTGTQLHTSPKVRKNS